MSTYLENSLQESHSAWPLLIPPPPGKITRISEAQYRGMVDRMTRYSETKRSPHPEEPIRVTVVETVQDFLARKDLSRSSRMAYRSALLWYLRNLGDQSLIFRTAYALLLAMAPGDAPIRKRANRKSIPEPDFEAIINELSDMGFASVWAIRTQAWIHATLACGARPIEWLDAWLPGDLEGHVAMLTAKAHVESPRCRRRRKEAASAAPDSTPGEIDDPAMNFSRNAQKEAVPLRVRGAKRVVPLLSPFDRFMVETHLTNFQEAVKPYWTPEQRLSEYRKYHDQCRWVLRKACERIWHGKKSYTLYTFRSQFQANRRAMLGAAETAGLMGHSSETSPSTAYYGKANQAHSRYKGERTAPTDFLSAIRQQAERVNIRERHAGYS